MIDKTTNIKLPDGFIVTAEYDNAMVGHIDLPGDNRNGWTFMTQPKGVGLHVKVVPFDRRAFAETVSYSFMLMPTIPLAQMIRDVEEGRVRAASLFDVMRDSK